MRLFLVFFTVCLTAGCSATRLVEGPLDESSVAEIKRLCEDGCSAEVVLDESGTPNDMSRNAESLYSRLEGMDVRLRLDDSSVLQGRVSRFVHNPEMWIAGRPTAHGGLTDTVHVRASTIDSVWIHNTIRTSRLQIDGNALLFDSDDVVPMGSVAQITVAEIESKRRSTFRWGLLIGAIPGAVGGGIAGGALCGIASDGYGCFHSPRNDALGIFVGVTAAGAVSGALVGGLIGALVGKKETTVYRFRPDTPQQMSVVIGAGPSMNQSGGGR